VDHKTGDAFSVACFHLGMKLAFRLPPLLADRDRSVLERAERSGLRRSGDLLQLILPPGAQRSRARSG